MEYRIFLASLTAYNQGMIDGVWVDLKDANAMDKIKAFKDAREEHEFFISDSMTSVTMNISEYDNTDELIAFVKRLENLDALQLEAYDAIMSELDFEREEALDKVENWEFDAIEWDGGNIEEAVGGYYAELSGWLEYDETIRIYFDYEAYGRDICIDSEVCDNGDTIFVLF